MKNRIRRVLALILCFVMVFGGNIAVFAENVVDASTASSKQTSAFEEETTTEEEKVAAATAEVETEVEEAIPAIQEVEEKSTEELVDVVEENIIEKNTETTTEVVSETDTASEVFTETTEELTKESTENPVAVAAGAASTVAELVTTETVEQSTTEETEGEQDNSVQLLRSEVEKLETLEKLAETDIDKIDSLKEEKDKLFAENKLTADEAEEITNRLKVLTDEYYHTYPVAEVAVGDNWKVLAENGWLDEYSEIAAEKDVEDSNVIETQPPRVKMMSARTNAEPSDEQVVNVGGNKTSEEGDVSITKTIDGTNLENVFDITLRVETTQKIEEVYEDPDVAVVVVMDISNTMKADFGDTSRYEAAMDAAEEFVKKFESETTANGSSRLGYVAFNTHAHEIFSLQNVNGKTETLINQMRNGTYDIMDPDGCGEMHSPEKPQCKYASSHDRFTNIEAGLKMANDMLENATNKNKYIIFLSDGFPTTYLNNDTSNNAYDGYDPYTGSGVIGNDGVFYDYVIGAYCNYGTSYSDKAAIRAREMASAIKTSGIQIFSIGVDVGGQTIQQYLPIEGAGYSIVDRTSTIYELGEPTSTQAFKDWLGNKIGSEIYYDSTNSDQLSAAYDDIFVKIKTDITDKAEAEWVAADPMPVNGKDVEFLYFYNKDGNMEGMDITGSNVLDGENTASYNSESTEITWQIQKSGYKNGTLNGNTSYIYELVYRVRLKNENSDFIEKRSYDTNDKTTLTYRVIQTVNGEQVRSEEKTLDFPIPAVKGYLADLEFMKVNQYDNPVVGAEFTLSHDMKNCSICRGDETAVTIENRVVASGTDGKVLFEKIPSGHKYLLEETKVPAGHFDNARKYIVEVAFDEVTVTMVDSPNDWVWEGKIINEQTYELPSSGGSGMYWYIISGMALMMSAALILHNKKYKEVLNHR